MILTVASPENVSVPFESIFTLTNQKTPNIFSYQELWFVFDKIFQITGELV